MIILTTVQFKEIVDHALANLPAEACGLLGGVVNGETSTVKKVYLLSNIDHSPEHFSMDPKEQFAAIKDIRSNGWVMLGNFHSHPETPSRPSAEDRRLAFDAEILYLILSLIVKEQPVLKAFRINGGEVREEPLNILEIRSGNWNITSSGTHK
ncbi:MAG: M67 family metallopeptidase [Bacillota bacterium]